jgi:phenol/toluene 2-monooxygenase (NADH) P5/A5
MTYQLTIEPLGETIEVAENQRILDACLRAGIWLPYACNHGLCGTCKVQVLEGEVVHTDEASAFALMDVERDEGKCLACSTMLATDCVIEADIEPEPDAKNFPIRDFFATVTRIEALTPTIKGIFLEVPEGELAFQAGQYLNVTVPGVEGPRAFSIASSPASRHELELNVRRVDGGAATAYLCERLKVGDRISCSGPLGRFFVRESAPEPLLFLAGGSGLSSPKSMILDLFERAERRAVTLIYGARTRAELYYAELFQSLAKEHTNFTYIPVLSEIADDAWEGATGFVHEAAGRHFNGRFEGHKAYLCGPPAMIEACLRTLMQGRLFERDIYLEKFLTAADAAQGIAKSPLFRRL